MTQAQCRLEWEPLGWGLGGGGPRTLEEEEGLDLYRYRCPDAFAVRMGLPMPCFR